MICYNDEDLEKTQRIFEAAHATDNLIIEQKIEAVKIIVSNLHILKK